jgi:hypothetical protein
MPVVLVELQETSCYYNNNYNNNNNNNNNNYNNNNCISLHISLKRSPGTQEYVTMDVLRGKPGSMETNGKEKRIKWKF